MSEARVADRAPPLHGPVERPAHYTQGGVECIDAIHAALGREGFIAFCQGNAMKYLWRWRHKGGAEDLRKARWYLDRMIEVMDGDQARA